MNELMRSAMAILLAIFLGVFVGWTLKSQAIKSGEVRQARAAVKEVKQEIAQSAVISTTLETAIRSDATRIDKIEVAVAERIKTNTPIRHDPYPRSATSEAATHTDLACVPDEHRRVLDAGTVRLLNAARAGIQPTASELGQERAAASTVR